MRRLAPSRSAQRYRILDTMPPPLYGRSRPFLYPPHLVPPDPPNYVILDVIPPALQATPPSIPHAGPRPLPPFINRSLTKWLLSCALSLFLCSSSLPSSICPQFPVLLLTTAPLVFVAPSGQVTVIFPSPPCSWTPLGPFNFPISSIVHCPNCAAVCSPNSLSRPARSSLLAGFGNIAATAACPVYWFVALAWPNPRFYSVLRSSEFYFLPAVFINASSCFFF
ncbi:hypothetical protein DFH08DRAFT_984562, partial [Mycena albidolilacea]